MTDYALMVALWNSGQQGRREALAMADTDRKQATLNTLKIETGPKK